MTRLIWPKRSTNSTGYIELALFWPWEQFIVGAGYCTGKDSLGASFIVLQFGVGSLLLWKPKP